MTVLAPRTLTAALAARGDAPALVGPGVPGGTMSYADLAAAVEREATASAAHHGARRLVLLEAGRDAGSVVRLLGAWAAGHAVLLAGPGTADGLAATYGLDDPDHCPDLHPDLALLLSTSGSTGSPKTVRLSADNLLANARQIVEALGIRSTDVAATTLPLHYCFGLSVLTSHLLAGAAVLLTDESVTSEAFWADAAAHGVTTFPGVPHTYDLLERSGFAERELPTLRYLTQAGGRMDPAVVRRFAELGQRKGFDLVVMYGQTEATARMAVLPADLALERPGCIGRPVPGGSFRLDGDELVYAGPNVMLGYAHGPEDLALGRTGTELRTGDLARIHDDGLVEITGRTGRFAKVLGLRVDLDRTERLLAARGCVATAADGGDRLVLGVASATKPVDPGWVAGLAAEETGLPATSVAVVVLPELPRLASGKVDARALVAAAAEPDPETPAAPAAGAPVAVDAGRVCEVVGTALRRPARPEDTFVGLGGDSLSYVEVGLRLERLLGALPPDWPTRTMADLADLAHLADLARARRAGGAGRAGASRRALGRLVETNVLLRAFAIVSIVGTHANLFTLLGGAHLLLAVAGFNAARFHLTDVPRGERVRRLLRGALRIAAPSALVISVVSLWTDGLGWRQMLLLNGLTSTRWTEPQWYYWFIEALVYILVAVAGLLLVLDRVERRHPFWLPVGLAAVALLTRYGVLDLPGDEIHRAHVVFWLFALGWAAARATTHGQRWLLTALAVGSVPGFFDEGARNAYVAAGLVALVWLPQVRVPDPVARLAGVLAAASLWTYLVHWQVYPWLEHRIPVLATLLSLLAGVTAWWLAGRAGRWLATARDRRGAGFAGRPGIDENRRWFSPEHHSPAKGTHGDSSPRPGTPGGHDQPAHLPAGPARHR